ncbi:MAG: AraC family transcriptional regulator ligand-binding domain-containing protein [bacterium]
MPAKPRLAPPEEGDLPGNYVLELVELTGDWGVRASELLHGLRLTPRILADPGTRLPISTCAEIVRRALALTGEPGLAFSMGMKMRISMHGFLGFAAMTAANVREALTLAERFSRTRTTLLSLRSYTEAGRGVLAIENCDLRGEAFEFLVVTLFVGLWQIGNALTGRSLSGWVDFSFAEPAHFRRFANLVPGRMRFRQPQSRLLFPESILDLPLVSADPVATRLAREQCERELQAIGDTGRFVARVRALVAAGGERAPALEDVARALHLSDRTLKRRLAENRTSYRQLLDEVRLDRARRLLADPDLSMERIAAQLGYSDVANFTRAYKRWTGTTPAASRPR